jgi:hypothetical protein
MILFTRRLMPAELQLQSDRETQKSEIYFTDYTLAGQPGLIRSGSLTRAGDPQGQSVHKVGSETLGIFILPITLWLGNRTVSPPRVRMRTAIGARVGLLVKPSQSTSQLYFTDYTLTGQPGAYSFWKSGAGRKSVGTVSA